ncbi:MAG: hypothetical protein FJ284_09045 [Planctomycetes bacterium]|nr:hypothetical protein [Planctomycetota bacterium]
MPAQRRNARGWMQAVDSQIMQPNCRLDYAYDNVRAEVQDAYSKLEQAHEFHRQALQQEQLAALVADAEREQVRLGRGDILRVTLREQAKFDADLLTIAARQGYWKVDVDLRAADTSLDANGTGLDQGRLPARARSGAAAGVDRPAGRRGTVSDRRPPAADQGSRNVVWQVRSSEPSRSLPVTIAEALPVPEAGSR